MDGEQLRDKELRDRELRDRELRVRELRDRELRDRELRDRELRDRELRDKELRDKELRDRELRDKELRDKELRDKELRDRELRNKEIRDKGLRDKIYDIIMDVAHNSQLHTLAKSDNQKKAFEMKMDEAMEELYELLSGQQLIDQQIDDPSPNPNPQDQSLREFTVEQLAQFNGSQGNPAYVGVNGNVYDVTKNIHWAGGTHFGLNAGQNHTNDFMVCHSGMVQILQGLTVIGKMV